MGDLSGKYGSLDKKKAIKEVHNDTSLPMFGLHSIIGRSIVIHKKRRGERWACSSIGWGWDPDEAKQVTAIASFHHPNGFAWGYIRFSQVVYNDGSSTDTVIQVRLKHPAQYLFAGWRCQPVVEAMPPCPSQSTVEQRTASPRMPASG